MRIKTTVVVTNDDGIEAEGLNALVNALASIVEGPLYVVAPDTGYSGCSQQVTMNSPIGVREVAPRRFAVSGSPADCVRLALTHLVPACGLVLSGINHGGNMGHDILLSGTVGAAREAAMLGVSAVALSQYFHGQKTVDWTQSAAKALKALTAIEALAISGVTLWNVNLPHDSATLDDTPISHCHPCTVALPVAYEKVKEAYHYDGGRYHQRAQEPGTDVSTCFGGSIALSRLSIAPQGMDAGDATTVR